MTIQEMLADPDIHHRVIDLAIARQVREDVPTPGPGPFDWTGAGEGGGPAYDSRGDPGSLRRARAGQAPEIWAAPRYLSDVVQLLPLVPQGCHWSIKSDDHVAVFRSSPPAFGVAKDIGAWLSTDTLGLIRAFCSVIFDARDMVATEKGYANV